MVGNADDRAIVKATIDLAHSLGLSVIAEGVDDAKALQLLTEMGCDQAQGFLIARPQSANDLLKWHVESPWGQALYRHPPNTLELAQAQSQSHS
jgi:EAL domain-containing protein (putative c-di-GMP-specific phosphodiesterase class I)